MVGPLRHRQTKEAETDMFGLQPPRHIPTPPILAAKVTGRRVPIAVATGADRNVRQRMLTSVKSRNQDCGGTNPFTVLLIARGLRSWTM
jgi:hypothetical protein